MTKHLPETTSTVKFLTSDTVSGKRFKPVFKKNFLFLMPVLLLYIFSDKLSAQVSTYLFATPTNPTFTQYTTTTTLWNGTGSGGTGDNNVTTTQIPIGFSFNFNGTTYTTVGVSTNGFIWFGSGTASATEYTPISDASSNLGGSGTINGVVAGFACNSYLKSGGSIGYGNPTASTFEIQWYHTQTSGTEWDCQMILNGTNNSITINLNDEAYGFSSSISGQMGLRGTSNADYNNLSTGSNNFLSPVQPGASNAATGTQNPSYFGPSSGKGVQYIWTYNPPCTGTPSPGTISSTPSGVCASTTSGAAGSVLSLPSLPSASGYTYSWQSSPDNATWSAASGTATNSTYTTPTSLPSTPTYYMCTINCPGGGGSPTSTTTSSVSINYNSTLSCYCKPVLTATTNEGISNVTISQVTPASTVYNSSTLAVPEGGVSYTLNSTSLPQLSLGVQYTIQVTSGNKTKNDVAAWIDYNQDGTFTSSTEQIPGSGTNLITTSTANQVSTAATFTVPGTALTGTTMMRITTINNNTSPSQCPTSGNGEVLDFYVSIIGAACSGTPTPGNVYTGSSGTNTTATVCPNATQAMYVTGQTTGVSGITYQWQSSSTSGGTYTNVSGGSGATSPNYTTPTLTNTTTSAITTYYLCQITCSGSPAVQSTPVAVTVNPKPSLTINGSNTYTASMCNTGSPNSVALAVSDAASDGGSTYSWSPNTTISPSNTSASVTVTPPATTTYTVTGTANSCTATATAVITVNPTAITFNPNSPTIAIGGNASITASATSSNGPVTNFVWSSATTLSPNTGIGATVTASPLSTTIYSVTATDPAGCSITGSETVNVSSGTIGTVSCGYTVAYVTGSSYTTASSLGTPTVVASGASIDNSVYPNEPIGFSFVYNDQTYTTLGISSNTFVWFGTGSPSATNFTPLSSTTGQTGTVDGIISVFGMDNAAFSSAAAINVVTYGTVGSRTCVIEWYHFITAKDNAVACLGSAYMYPESDFQIRLYEGTNNIELWYNSSTYDLSAASGNQADGGQVGIMGASTSDYQTRSAPCGSGSSWSGSVAGTNTSVCNISGGCQCNTKWPVTGDNFRFTPTAKPTITPTGQQNICTGGSGVTLTAVNSGSMSSPTYQWQLYGSPNTSIGGQAGTTYTANPGTPGNYFYDVQLTSGSCVRYSNAEAVVVASCGPTLTTSGTLGALSTTYGTASAYTSFTASGSNLTANIIVTPPAGFEISLSPGSGYGSSVTLTETGGTVGNTTIYVRLAAATAVGSYSGNVSLTSTGATTVNVATASSTVNAASLTITANSISKCYGQTHTFAGTEFTTSTLYNSDNVTSVTLSSSGASSGATVGGSPYSIVPSAASGSGLSNYNITYTNGSLTVNAVPSVSSYGSSNPSTCSGTDGNITLNGLNASTTYSVSYDLNSSAEGPTSIETGVTGILTLGSLSGGSYNNIIVSLSGCSSSAEPASGNITLSGPCSSSWSGAPGADWSNPSNWSPPGVPNGCAANVTITSGTPVISVTDISVGNITLSSGVTLTLNGKNLNVCGSWTGGSGSSAAIVGTGTTFINGSIAQTLGGNTQFDILQINNSNGVTLNAGAAISISGGLQLQSGQLDVSSGTLHLLSTASNNNSYIDDFTGTGTLKGGIVADRYVPVAGYNQHFISSPVSGAALSQIGASGPDGSYVTPTSDCDEYQSASGTAYGSVFIYNDAHAQAGGCKLANWEVKSSGNMTAGQGYSTYQSGNQTLSVSGTANTGAISVNNLVNSGDDGMETKQLQTIGRGWVLVGNPYPSAINLTNTRTGFGNQVQVWQTSGPFAGTWQPYVIGDGPVVIPPFQAFMAQISGSAGTNYSYSFYQSERTRSTTTSFYRSSADNSLQLQLSYNGMQDVTTVKFNPSGTTGFDFQYDAVKSDGGQGRPTLYTTMNDYHWYSINNLPSLEQTTTVGVGLHPEVSGSMTISASGIESFDPTTYIYLEDQQTNTWQNLRSGAYSFTTNASDAQNRFVLHFSPPVQILTSDANCSNAGMINITQPGSASWSYTLTNNNNIAIASGTLNSTNPINIGATAGIYTLTLTDNSGYQVIKNVQVGGQEQVIASIKASATSVQLADEVTFASTSSGAVVYNWNFGDGNTATGQSVTHNYLLEGVYTVQLTVTNTAGCVSTATRTVTVTSRDATGIQNVSNNGKINIWSNENRVYVDFSQEANVDAQVDIYNVLGQVLSSEKFGKSSIYSKEIDNLEAAYMIIRVKNNTEVTTKKVFIANVNK